MDSRRVEAHKEITIRELLKKVGDANSLLHACDRLSENKHIRFNRDESSLFDSSFVLEPKGQFALEDRYYPTQNWNMLMKVFSDVSKIFGLLAVIGTFFYKALSVFLGFFDLGLNWIFDC